jgi:hypothetical protein
MFIRPGPFGEAWGGVLPPQAACAVSLRTALFWAVTLRLSLSRGRIRMSPIHMNVALSTV